MNDRIRGTWVHLREGEYGPAMLDEVFFWGHCDETEIEWDEVAEFLMFEERLEDDDPVSDAREFYGRLQHVYGRIVPEPEGDRWTWHWQREPGRGAMRVTRLMERQWAQSLRLWRRRRKAAERRARRQWPGAKKVQARGLHEPDGRTVVTMSFDALKGRVEWVVGDAKVRMRRQDVPAWRALYGVRSGIIEGDK